MILKPWLYLPSEWGHSLSPLFFKTYGQFFAPQHLQWQPFEWKNLKFANPLGVAGGFDKNAELIQGFWALGAGFTEVGTITPLPQNQNPGKVIDRDLKNKALWNQLGFPSKGMNQIYENLNKIPKPHFTPIFVNIGKNRSTPLENAHRDYIQLLKKLNSVADVFVVNISSPNTQQLRDLLKPKNLAAFIKPIVEENNLLENKKPLLLKLSPDMETDELKQVLDISFNYQIDGWILTNTTLSRYENCLFPNTGGVSGEPLKHKSLEALKLIVKHVGKQKEKLIVSAGGVSTKEDILERLHEGAHLTQVYSSLVFEGPFFFRKVHKSLKS